MADFFAKTSEHAGFAGVDGLQRRAGSLCHFLRRQPVQHQHPKGLPDFRREIAFNLPEHLTHDELVVIPIPAPAEFAIRIGQCVQQGIDVGCSTPNAARA